jgi:wyosine [tRNA(Phe)-imidazoG37] synthetase (radical SAM superfamily)
MKIIYGPVASWRLGRSLGVDLICTEKKTCTFDCIYCQLEKTKPTTQRKTFVSIEELEEELQHALQQTKPDVITFSGMGEPTLAKNMQQAIKTIRTLTHLPIAILTNSSTMYNKNVRNDLKELDVIVAKLDAANQQDFHKINQPAEGITFEKTIEGIKKLRKEFNGKFALQIMFTEENKDKTHELVKITKEIQPDEVQINTPLRPCNIHPLSEKQLDEIEKKFTGLNTLNVYKASKPKTTPLDRQELIKRRRPEP